MQGRQLFKFYANVSPSAREPFPTIHVYAKPFSCERHLKYFLQRRYFGNILGILWKIPVADFCCIEVVELYQAKETVTEFRQKVLQKTMRHKSSYENPRPIVHN